MLEKTIVAHHRGNCAGRLLASIPGIGPILTAGPIIATLAGAGAGAVAGGVIGSLTEIGVEKKDAELYAEAVRRGGTLVTLRAEESRADEASAILRKAGAIDITRRAEDWRATGWMGDASAKGERARTRVQTPDVGEPMASSTGLSDSAWAMDEEIRSRAGPGTHIPR